jgi:hypothetical protein
MRADSTWIARPITYEEYFDPRYREGLGQGDIDDVPHYDHAVEYLDVDISQIENTRITLLEEGSGLKRVITETFWNRGKNRVIERSDTGPVASSYWELILDCKVERLTSSCEILRIGRSDDVLAIYSHVYVEDHADGSQTEEMIYPDEKGSHGS